MILKKYKKTIFSLQTLQRLVSSFLQFLGTISLVLGILGILFPNEFHYGYEGVIWLLCISLIGALFTIIPRREISRQFSVPDIKITIKVGDLFQEGGNLVIGTNDVFDTDIDIKRNIIKPTSIQGQFLTKVYKNNLSQLDKDIENALQGLPGNPDNRKTIGKNIRYPIGTVATLTVNAKKYFCSAYSYMGDDSNFKAQSSIKDLSNSLEMLWQEIGLKGSNEKVVMAVLGSDLARIGNAAHADLIQLIVSSFILASRVQPITKELAIIIHHNNLEKINMIKLDNFLQNF